MKPEEIHITDTMRILLGEVPWSFLIEVVIRIVFIFVLLIVSMRLLGKRMASQLTRNELAAMSSLAAAIGVPMMAPDRGLLPALIIACVVILIQRGITTWTFYHKKAEVAVLGDLGIMVEEGCIRFEALKTAVLTKERVMAHLRSEGIENLGQVQRMYMESSGDFSLFRYAEPKPGLSIIPDWDREFRREQKVSDGDFACENCGHLVQYHHRPSQSCRHCGHQDWQPAVISQAETVAT